MWIGAPVRPAFKSSASTEVVRPLARKPEPLAIELPPHLRQLYVTVSKATLRLKIPLERLVAHGRLDVDDCSMNTTTDGQTIKKDQVHTAGAVHLRQLLLRFAAPARIDLSFSLFCVSIVFAYIFISPVSLI